VPREDAKKVSRRTDCEKLVATCAPTLSVIDVPSATFAGSCRWWSQILVTCSSLESDLKVISRLKARRVKADLS